MIKDRIQRWILGQGDLRAEVRHAQLDISIPFLDIKDTISPIQAHGETPPIFFWRIPYLFVVNLG